MTFQNKHAQAQPSILLGFHPAWQSLAEPADTQTHTGYSLSLSREGRHNGNSVRAKRVKSASIRTDVIRDSSKGSREGIEPHLSAPEKSIFKHTEKC